MALQPFVRYLDTNGDGTGTTQATGNYSGTPTDFFFQVPSNRIASLSSYFVNIWDVTGSFSMDRYGDLAELTNGISLITVLRGVTNTRFSGVKNNYDLVTASADYSILHENNDLYIKIKVVFPDNNGDFLKMDTVGDKFIFRLNDNFTGLKAQQFVVRGLINV